MKKLEIIGTITAGVAVLAITLGLGLGIGTGGTTHADAAPPTSEEQADPTAGMTSLLAPVLQTLGFGDSAELNSNDMVTQMTSLMDLLSGGSSASNPAAGLFDGLLNQNGQSNSIFNWGTPR
jgi:hypothetical protein